MTKKRETKLHSKNYSLKNKAVKATSNISTDTELGFRLDELNEKQLEIYAQNSWLVNLVNKGISIRESLIRLDLNRSERSVRNLIKRYEKYGSKGLIDKRWLRITEATVLLEPTKKIILFYFLDRPAAGARIIWKATCKECEVQNLPKPSESSIKKYIQSLPQVFKMFRHGKLGVRQWQKEAAPVVRFENTSYSNERWQGDHTELPIWIKVKVNSDWKPFRAFASALLDVHSRSISGFIISTKYPDAWTIALLFRQAICSKKITGWKNRGIPHIFQSDRGRDFLSRAIAATLTNLNVIFDTDPPYYPNSKGKIERFFETLDVGSLRILPGHILAVGTSETAAEKRIHELLTLSQLRSEIERFIVDDGVVA